MGGKQTLAAVAGWTEQHVKKSKRIVIGLIVATILLTPIVGFLLADKVVPLLGPMLPRPNGVPDEASASYDFKEGIVWRWRRTVHNGCAKWMAMDSWTTVALAQSDEGCNGKGGSLNYASFGDEVVFDWGRGDWAGGSPCPFTVPASEIAAYIRVAREARNAASTDAERAMLVKIEQRLAKTDGNKLTTDSTGGCNDLKAADLTRSSNPHLHV